MVIKEDSFTYEDFRDKLVDTEIKLMLEIFKYMTEDNLIYLYQRVSKRINKTVIEQIGINLCITPKTVQNRLYSILKKQDEMRYFLYPTESKIKGEYFISPELALKDNMYYEDIYTSIIPKIQKRRINV